jgi:hypothetical protein
MSVDKLRVFHEELLQEEGVKVSELPTEIQQRIRGFNLMRKKLQNNPDDEKLFVQIQKQAVKLGDDVQNFIENDYEDSDDDDDDDDKGEKDDKVKRGKPVASKSNENRPASSKSNQNDGEKSSNTKPTAGGKFGNSMMEKKVMSIMQSRGDNRIRITDLESIIGKEPDYPEQQVNNIKLRKVFLSSDYRLV